MEDVGYGPNTHRASSNDGTVVLFTVGVGGGGPRDRNIWDTVSN